MSNRYGPRIVTDGLVLCLDAADRNCYAGTGSTAYDQSGNGNNGTFINSPSYTTDYGGCFTFEATNDRIETVTYGYQTSVSWEAWVNKSSSPNSYNMFMGQHLPYFALWNSGSVLFANNIGGTQRNLTSYTTFSNDTWYHLVFTTSYDGTTNTTMSIYVNGELDRAYTYAGSQVTYYGYKFSIGDGRNNNWYQFNGMVTGVKVYNGKTLSANEVLQNYNATKGRFGL